MIVLNLSCDREHRFEGWFSSNEDFDRQHGRKMLACPLCGSGEIVRLPSAPHVRTGAVPRDAGTAVPTPGRHYANLAPEVVTKLIDHIIDATEDVGAAFPEEARKIHYHEVPERQIRGTASNREVHALRDEGIEIVALPIPPHRAGKTH
ncbi:MAG: DUF1178 family protein [Sulfuricaulis sp.]|uniref:DUF1178 family protein n=1 Tax=Sulfuricaulis sp. TaxID=2003553 RepID=UPI0034A29815